MNRPCRDFQNNLTPHLAGELQPAAEKRLLAHLQACPDCQAALAELQPAFEEIRQTLSAAAGEQPRLSPDRRTRILNAARQAAAREYTFADRLARWMDAGFRPSYRIVANAAVILLIVGVLSGLLLPSLSMTRERGRRTAAMNAEKQRIMVETLAREEAEPAMLELQKLEDLPTVVDSISIPAPVAPSPVTGPVGADDFMSGFAMGDVSGSVERKRAAKSDRSDRSDGSDKSDLSYETVVHAVPSEPAPAAAGKPTSTLSLDAPLPTKSPIIFKGLWTGRSNKGRELKSGEKDELNADRDGDITVTVEPATPPVSQPEPTPAPGASTMGRGLIASGPAGGRRSGARDELREKITAGTADGYTIVNGLAKAPKNEESASRSESGKQAGLGDIQAPGWHEGTVGGLVGQSGNGGGGVALGGKLGVTAGDKLALDNQTIKAEVAGSTELAYNFHFSDAETEANGRKAIEKKLSLGAAKGTDEDHKPNTEIKKDTDSDGGLLVSGARGNWENKSEFKALEKKEREAANLFRAYGVNPYVETAKQPFSTFAIDVDTASYTFTRNNLLQGRLPPPESVRTEEIVNFFDYHYSPPPADAMFAVHSQCAPSPFRPGQQLLRIGVKARRLGREENRASVLTFAIDTSGSMSSPERLGLVQQSLALLVDRLSPDDRVAIVQFDSHARLVLDYTRAADKARILAAIRALQTSGSTNLEEGMRLAYESARRAFQPGAGNRVLLLSDGAANLGGSTAEEILAVVADSRRQGIFCSVYGVGRGGLNDAMLESLANKGDGAYVYLDSLAEARRVFVDELAASLNTVAADVKIQVEFAPARVEQYRQIGYENRQLKKEDFRNDAIDAGEVGSGQSVTALYELGLAAGSRGPLGVVRIRYRDLRTGRIEEIAAPLSESMLTPSFSQAEPAFQLAACAAEWAEILRGSPYAEGDDPRELATLLRRAALQYALDGRVQECVRLVETTAQLKRESR
jgi:Ca-activated chloride channel family protein